MITASTPTFSADKAKIPATTTVATIEEAREAAAAWDISKVPALQKRGGVEGILQRSDAKNAEGLYDLESILKKCYHVAFYMPPSPSAHTRSPALPKPTVGNSPPPLAI